MDFLKKIFGGFGGGPASPRGLFYYVQPKGCQEVVRVRIDTHNDLSLADDNTTYFVRKMVRGTTYKCTRTAELYLTFDNARRVQNTEVTNGTLVSETDYDAWVASQETPST